MIGLVVLKRISALWNATPVSITATVIEEAAPGLMSHARSMSMAGKFHCREYSGSLGTNAGRITISGLGVFHVRLCGESLRGRLRVCARPECDDVEVWQREVQGWTRRPRARASRAAR